MVGNSRIVVVVVVVRAGVPHSNHAHHHDRLVICLRVTGSGQKHLNILVGSTGLAC